MSKQELQFELFRFQVALKRVLDNKTQLLPYMRTEILQDTIALYEKIPDREVKIFMKMEI